MAFKAAPPSVEDRANDMLPPSLPLLLLLLLLRPLEKPPGL